MPDEETAFTGRDALFWASAEIQWDELELDDACRAWGRSALDEAQPYESAGRYVNDVAEVGRDLARTIYGDDKYERLRALKREWDPENVSGSTRTSGPKPVTHRAPPRAAGS